MILLWCLLLTTAVQTEVVTNEDPDQIPNVTTLYPVSNKTDIYYTRNETAIQIDKLGNLDRTSWKIDASYAESDLNKDDNATDITSIKDTINSEENDDVKDVKYAFVEENTGSKEANLPADFNFGSILNAKDTQDKVFTDFKPSQPLGTFFDDEFVTLPTPITNYASTEREPSPLFISSPPAFVPHSYPSKPPVNIPKYKPFPYKYEIPSKSNIAWHQELLEAKPTVAVPDKVPAGGLYKLNDPFQDRPISSEDLGLSAHGDYKEEYHIKKRVDPWKNLLHLITAFIPVGLIISALTPNVITIQNTGPNNPNSNIYRRSEIPDVAAISEQCKRRLLCELRSETNYFRDIENRRKGKQCFKIHCEDTHTVQKMLHWLFNYYRPGVDQAWDT